MILQTIIFPDDAICSQSDLYFHGDVEKKDEKVKLTVAAEKSCEFDSYFNGFSIDKWREYTQVRDIYLCLRLLGKGRVIAKNKYYDRQSQKLVDKEIKSVEVDFLEPADINIFFESECQGVLYFVLEAKNDNLHLCEGYYCADIEESLCRDVAVGIGICTYKREQYVTKNIDNFCKNIFDNEKSIIRDNIEVFISDNGQSLDKYLELDKLNEHIHVFSNKNAGGAGGFTRTLMEMNRFQREGKKLTHALLMDDDVTFDAGALERTFMMLRLLKDEYKDSFIGGAMLRNDLMDIQVEAGAAWNGGRVISYKNNIKLDNSDNCVLNELEESYDYNAWWYCCFPITVPFPDVNEASSENKKTYQSERMGNLPLPIFVRGDDIEYGLRNMKNLILLNGICVWHEPFENKYSSFLEYYYIRNWYINNSLYKPSYNAFKAIKDLLVELMREIFYYRYKSAMLLIKGAEDFLKGIDFIKTTDAQALHKEIMEYGYKAVPFEELSKQADIDEYNEVTHKENTKAALLKSMLCFNGYFLKPKAGKVKMTIGDVGIVDTYRTQSILFYDKIAKKAFVCTRDKRQMWAVVKEFLKTAGRLLFDFKKTATEYRKRINEVQTTEFWNRYLEL